jgi:antitoxin component YwqK of YwqJK toxin-antitoxin module
VVRERSDKSKITATRYMNTLKQIMRPLALTIFTIGISFSSKACGCMPPRLLDSLAQLAEYSFIAHVKIIDDQDYKGQDKDNIGDIGLLTIQIIELFKGDSITQILEYSKRTSCDMGISKGEEWILFGRSLNGKIVVGACDRDACYKRKTGERDWQYWQGFHELITLRELYNHPIKKYQNETRIEYYSNGQREIEETYVNGKREGERKLWYPDGRLRNRQCYINDTLDGKSEWFYPSGQIYEEENHIRGKHNNVWRLYFDTTNDKTSYEVDKRIKKIEGKVYQPVTYPTIQPHYEWIYDHNGNPLIHREYKRTGTIYKEETFDWARNFRVYVYYHDNGKVSSIAYYLNGKNYGHYQTYNEDGLPDRGWDYDENGEMLREKE